MAGDISLVSGASQPRFLESGAAKDSQEFTVSRFLLALGEDMLKARGQVGLTDD